MDALEAYARAHSVLQVTGKKKGEMTPMALSEVLRLILDRAMGPGELLEPIVRPAARKRGQAKKPEREP